MRVVHHQQVTSFPAFERVRLVAGFGIVLVILCGCEKPALVDNVPHDIRGQPIDSAPTNQSILASTSTNAETPTLAATANPADKSQPMDGGYMAIGFDKLSGYTFEMSDDLLAPATNDTSAATARTEAQIPATIKALDKQRVAVQGFMLPLKVEGGVVTEMLIMKDQSMCCYGVVPKINEWISIKMSKNGVKPIMDQPVTLYGTLRVGEMRENGYLVGIYAMDGEKMTAPAEN